MDNALSVIENNNVSPDIDTSADEGSIAFTPRRKPFVGVNIHSNDLFRSLPAAVARANTEIFNEVPGVSEKWSNDQSRQLVDQRSLRGSTGLAVLDAGRIIAVAYVDNVPSGTGFIQSQADLLVHPDYREGGLGRDLYLECMELAQRDGAALSKQYGITNFDPDKAISISQTYKKDGFPRSWWERVGYKVEPLFGITAQEVLNHAPLSLAAVTNNNIQVKEIEVSDFPHLIRFMSNPQTVTTDNGKWSQENARAYLQYMHRHNSEFIRMATLNGENVGLLIADTIPRRNGISLHQFNGFFKPDAERNVETIASVLTRRVVDLADMDSKYRYNGSSIKELEFEAANSPFFKEIIPGITQDSEFVVVKEEAGKIIKGLAQRAERRIAIHDSGKRLGGGINADSTFLTVRDKKPTRTNIRRGKPVIYAVPNLSFDGAP